MSADYTTAVKPARPQHDLLPHELDVRLQYEYAGKRESVTLKRRRTTFGRGDADVVLEDPTLSRKHFQVEVARNGVVLHDLASANGTIHHGRWITFANLKDTDTFQAGNTRFQIVIRTSNLIPARLEVLAALETDEASALAARLDGDTIAVRPVDSATLLESCRAVLPDLIIIDAGPRELVAIDNLKRLPRLSHTRVIALVAPENAFLRERCRIAGSDAVFDRPAGADEIHNAVTRLLEVPLKRAINLPASIKMESGGERHGRVLELHVRGARLRMATPPQAGTALSVKLLLPNEYGVVLVRGHSGEPAGDEFDVAFTAYEGQGQLSVRKIVRDTPSHS